jgi:coproporphyrinogen III oxidase-like Fe-S oxidoreductase
VVTIGSPRELAGRLALVQRALELSPEPLHAPLGLVFRHEDGDEHLRAWGEHAARAAAGAAFAPATLYVNIPFCARVCTYCLLSAVRAPGKDAVAAYVAALRRQIAMVEPLVGALRFGSIHIGGGTPTLLDEGQLDGLLSDLSRLPCAEGMQIGVEAHPATSTPGRLAVLRRHGVHRLSFGVESFTPQVLRNVNRADQTETRVRAAVAEAQRLGFEVNVDLLAGLPGETAESWDETVRKALELRPGSLSVNRFLGEASPLAALGYAPDRAENERADAMLLAADARIREVFPPRWPESPLTRPGFGTQYVWDRSEAARPYFQDDMIGPVSTLALGHGALGHIHGRCFSVPSGTLQEYTERLTRGEPPHMRICPIDERFERAFFVAEQACRGQLSRRAFARVFGVELAAAFPREVDFLLRTGLLNESADRVRKPPRLDFQVTHLLAFLLRDSKALAGEVRALEGARLAARSDDGQPVSLARGGDVDALVERHAAGGARVLQIDVGDGLDGDTATRLAALAAKKGLAIDVRGDDRRALREYAFVREEMPPSMLWVRIAIRAAQAATGRERLVVAGERGRRPPSPSESPPC